MDERPRGRLDAASLRDLLGAPSAPTTPGPTTAVVDGGGRGASDGAGGGPADGPGAFAALVSRRPSGPAPSAPIALVLAILLGGVGAHWLYLRRWGLAAGRLLVNLVAATLYAAGSAHAAAHPDAYGDATAPFLHLAGGALFVVSAVWWLVDVVGISRRTVSDAEGRLVV